MDSKPSTSQIPKKIDINELDYYSLNTLKKQIESELELLEQSVVDLHSARSKFSACSDSVKAFESVPNGNNIMIPLTTSLYVSGKTLNNNEFLIDVGTGYYIEKDRKNAKDYFDRKVKFLDTSIDRILKSIQEKAALHRIALQKQQQSVMAQLSTNAKSTTVTSSSGGDDNSPTTTTETQEPSTSSGKN